MNPYLSISEVLDYLRLGRNVKSSIEDPKNFIRRFHKKSRGRKVIHGPFINFLFLTFGFKMAKKRVLQISKPEFFVA